MNILPKDIQNLIFWHVWKMNMQNCYEEIQEKKLGVVDIIMEYHNCEELRDFRWKNARLKFSSFMHHYLYAKMVDHINYYCDIQLMLIFSNPDDFEDKWEWDAFNILSKIHQTRVWHEIPDIPKHKS